MQFSAISRNIRGGFGRPIFLGIVMINRFKLERKGQWKSKCGKKYTVVAIENASEHQEKDGWFKTLDEAIASKKPAASEAETEE